jgi:hypothetical protein
MFLLAGVTIPPTCISFLPTRRGEYFLARPYRLRAYLSDPGLHEIAIEFCDVAPVVSPAMLPFMAPEVCVSSCVPITIVQVHTNDD